MRKLDCRTRRRATPTLVATSLACLALGAPAALFAQDTNQPQYTIRARVPLTIVDVVVTDSKGHPVHGLKQSDFTVLEDDRPITPNNFEEYNSDEVATTPPESAPQPLPPNTFTNNTPGTPQSGPINILLIDNLNTPTQTQQRVQLEMLAYIKRMSPGTRMIVLGLNTHLFIVQGITSDKELLKAAISSTKNIAITPPTQDPGQDPLAKDIDMAAPGVRTATGACTDEVNGGLMAARAEYTLTAMFQIARYSAGMPGRKNLIWLGGSFPPKWDLTGGNCYDVTDALNTATDLLARAHVVLNPIDSRGLRVDNNTNAKLLEEHYNMQLRADQTGGKAVYTSNDLTGAAESAIKSGSNYYTLTYTPPNRPLDSKFRKISIKVDRPGLKLVYRPGYFAIDPENDPGGKAIEKVSPMQSAMMRGSLEPTQILFKVRVAQSPTTDALPSPANEPNPKLLHPPYRHYSISYVIDIHGIDFGPTPDANYRGGFEYGVRVYNTDGDEILNSVSKTVNPILPPAVYKSMLTGGANAHQEIDLPATGDYILRIAVHDLTTNHIGAIEVPTASIAPGPISTTR